MYQRFEFVEGSSKKFWEIQVLGVLIMTRWGKIGTEGQLKSKGYSSCAKADEAFTAAIAEKVAKGYREVSKPDGTLLKKTPEQDPRELENATKLFQAIEAGDLGVVSELLNAGVSPDKTNGWRHAEPPILLAARCRRFDIYNLLLDKGANRHVQDPSERTVLTEIACAGTPKMVQEFIDRGVVKNDRLDRALVLASARALPETISCLIAAGANVNFVSKLDDGATALDMAVNYNKLENVRILLNAGASMPEKRLGEESLLEVATTYGYTEIVKLLKNHFGPSPDGQKVEPDEVLTSPTVDAFKVLLEPICGRLPKAEQLKFGSRPPVTLERFRDLERVAKVKFPEELMALYSIMDGSSDVCFIPVPNDIDHYFMSSAELIYAWRTQKELLEGGDFEGRQGSGDTAIRTVWWSTKWIPFAGNGGGNYLCIDLSPAKGGVKGQIIFHNHEGGEHKILGKSLTSLLERLARDPNLAAV